MSNQGRLILERRGEGQKNVLLVLKESMGMERAPHTCNSRVSLSLKKLGKGHKMEDLESQTSELSFGISCASKVNDVREI